MYRGKDVLITLASLYGGDWEKIYRHVTTNRSINIEQKNRAYSELRANVISIMDDDFPTRFGQTFHPPFLLYYYGNIDILRSSHKLAVVGSRLNSDYGAKVTETLITDLHGLTSDLTVVSGMAKGIDSIAMRTAMKNNDKVIAILGSGIDNPYPEENRDIYDYCVNSGRGLVISEYPGKTEPLKEHFPFRNRLIAAAADALLLPEARLKSGSAITIKFALEAGLDILVVPHELKGDSLNNALIKDGAIVCTSAADILESFQAQAYR